ncbi:DUF397 domain-containing protein [Streptomyces sp. NPDC005955]|uniref:DUF397 domain-containing protein n=1 Tax=Streptomyces sp. NPDC005955 TaxID=3364738 RepID=UPI0036B2334D
MSDRSRPFPCRTTSLIDSTSLGDVHWHRSSRSTGMNNCIETARPAGGPAAGRLALRDSKAPRGPVLLFAPGTWTAFLDGIAPR